MLMQVSCLICSNRRFEESEFCKAHHRAYVQLESSFGKWRLAYGDEIGRRAFLERILQLPETGQKAREVGLFFLEKDEH